MAPSVRPLGLKLIIAYKVTKAALMLGLAVALTLAPEQASALAGQLVHELSQGGAFLRRLAAWLQEKGPATLVADARWVAWLDGSSTALEGGLLLSGKTWGEWVVIAGLAVLIPAELISLERHPSLAKAAVLAINAVIVAYLVHLRLRRTAPSP